MTERELAPCPFCGGRMMFRKALWPSDGCVDAIIHAGPPPECGMTEFSNGTTDESVIADWNARLSAGYGAGFEACREAAISAQPCTAENPNEDAYQRGKFDGVMEYAKAIAALPAPGGISTGWQPIETAPKGEGLIDVWTAGWGAEPHRVADCYYDSICDEWRTSRPTGQLICVKARYVTHWQPLPPAPTITRKS